MRGFFKRRADQRDRRGQCSPRRQRDQEALRLTHRLVETERSAMSTLSSVELLMLAELLGRLAGIRQLPERFERACMEAQALRGQGQRKTA